MANRIEGNYTEFLQMIMGKIAKQLGYGTWEMPGSVAMMKGGRGGRCGDAKRRRKKNFGPPWNTCRKLKVGGGAVGR